jgi:hypothetical protein
VEPVITPLLLASTGIDVPDDQVAPLLDYMNELLEERVGEAVVDGLASEQIQDLITLQKNASEEQVTEWIQSHVNNLDDIIEDQVDLLLGEAAEHHADFSSK